MSRPDLQRPLPIIHARRDRGPSALFRIEEIDLEFSNGEQRTYQRVHSAGISAVIVVAFHSPDEVCLIREYAAGLHHYELTLPKGRLERGEDILDAANRELQEEAGFAARNMTRLPDLSLAPGYLAHQAAIVAAWDLYPSRLPGDEPEPPEVWRWHLDALDELVQRPDCTEGRSIAALFMARELRSQIFE